MKKGSTKFLRVVLILMAVVVAVAMLWFPQTEGRNKNSDALSLYFNDPFLAYIYLGTIPFYFALFQAFKLLGYIEQNKAFSPASVKTLRNIKYCALVIIGLMVGAIVWVRIMSSVSGDDPAGFIAIGIVILFITVVIATFAGVLEKLFQNAVNIKSENDLTV